MLELTSLDEVPMRCASAATVRKYRDCPLDAEGWPICPVCSGPMFVAEPVRLVEGDVPERIGRGVVIARLTEADNAASR